MVVFTTGLRCKNIRFFNIDDRMKNQNKSLSFKSECLAIFVAQVFRSLKTLELSVRIPPES